MSTSWHLGVDVGSVHLKVVAIAPQGKLYLWVRPNRGKSLDVFTELFQAEIRKSVGKRLWRMSSVYLRQTCPMFPFWLL